MKHERIGELLEDAFSEEDLAAGWEAARARSGAITRRRQRVAAVGVVAALIAATVLVPVAWPRPIPPASLARVDGRPLRVLHPERVALTDGSRIEVAPGGMLEVIETTPNEISFHLVHGRSRFEVTPGTGRRWRVESAGISVSVVGTVFTTERDDRHVRVAVERGEVVVRGSQVPDGVRRLTAGRELTVVIAPAIEPAAAERESVERPVSDDAHTELPPPGTSRPSARALLRAADRARREGRVGDALRSLRVIVDDHPTSEGAPLAAFTVARLYADQGDADEARRWYRRALALGLREPLAESARSALEER